MADGVVQGLQRGPAPAYVHPQRRSGHADPGKGVVFHSQTLTASAALSPPEPNCYLVNIRVVGGVTPGTFGLIYTAPDTAHFPAPVSGVDATGAIGIENAMDYPVNWSMKGTNISSTLTSLNGGILRVELTYSNKPGRGPAISFYRAVAVTGNETTTAGTAKTYTFDAAPSSFRYFVCMESVQAGTETGIPRSQLIFPTNGAYTQTLEADGLSTEPPSWTPVLDMGSANSFQITHKCASLGGGATGIAIMGVGYY